MAERELLPVIPARLRQQINFDLADRQLSMLDDNARFIVRRLIGRAYGQGYDDGWCAGDDDARTNHLIAKEAARD